MNSNIKRFPPQTACKRRRRRDLISGYIQKRHLKDVPKSNQRIDQKRLLFIKAVSIFILFVNYFLGHPVYHLLLFIKVWKTGDRLIFCLLKASNNWGFASWGERQKRQAGPCRRHLCWPCSRRRWWEGRESKEVDSNYSCLMWNSTVWQTNYLLKISKCSFFRYLRLFTASWSGTTTVVVTAIN